MKLHPSPLDQARRDLAEVVAQRDALALFVRKLQRQLTALQRHPAFGPPPPRRASSRKA